MVRTIRYLLTCSLLLPSLLLPAQDLTQLDSIRQLPPDDARLKALFEVTVILQRTGHDSLVPLLEEGLRWSEEQGNRFYQGRYHHGLGYAVFNRGEVSTARDHHLRAAEVHLADSDTLWYRRNMYEAAYAMFALGDFEQANLTLLPVLRAFEDEEKWDDVAKNYDLLAMNSLTAGDRERAEDYARRAVAAAQRTPNPHPLAATRHHLATILLEGGQVDSALYYADAALEVAQDMYAEHGVRTARAQIYARQRNYQAALADLERVQEIEGGITDVGTMTVMGEVQQGLGNWAAARESLHRAIEINRGNDNNANNLSLIYALLQFDGLTPSQYDTATKYRLLASQYRDSVIREANTATTLELQEQYAAADREAEILAQQEQIARQRRQLLTTAGLLILALATGIAFYVLARRLRRRNAENERLVGEKQVLIGEIHHRVKNNLQVISSLLQLQSRDLQDEGALGALRESQGRVEAMGLIHQKLYTKDEVTTIHMPDYLNDLGKTLVDTYQLEDSVEVYPDVEDIDLDVDTAIPLGLIINELVTNSLKYGFPNGREGTIEVALRTEEDGSLSLRVSDDGVGKDAAPVLASSTSFGSNLVNLLTKKLRGMVTEEVVGRGHATLIRIPAQ